MLKKFFVIFLPEKIVRYKVVALTATLIPFEEHTVDIMDYQDIKRILFATPNLKCLKLFQYVKKNLS